MKIKKIVEKVESCSDFNEWKKDKEYRLAHVFYMDDEANKDNYQVGYYDSDNDKIMSFIIENNEARSLQEDEALKKHSQLIKKLDISKVDLELDDAKKIATELQQEKYSKDKPIKKIFILQHIEQGQVWNVTFITEAFRTLNIKIDAKKGNIISDNLISLTDLGKTA